MKITLTSIFLIIIVSCSKAQTGSYLDPGQAYVKLLIDNGGGTQQRIGVYKVNGTSYLFGEKHTGDLFGKGEKGESVFISYNTYSQQVEFYVSFSQSKPLIKNLEMVDSFTIKKGKIAEITKDVHFINGIHLGAKEKGFYQMIENGKRFKLYKKYKSNLAVVSTSYAQSDLRQFELEYDYYYTDSTTKKMKKIKHTPYDIKKEFNFMKDISNLVDDYSFAQEPENCLKMVFDSLNNL
ncbi:MAG: hypothetical protein H7Z13_13215 [Ferruginibacter sp.]|nr:hypothetical protein [Ferruginibacter sp.]